MNQDFLRFDDEAARFRLILLHGWGADATDLIPLGQEIIKALEPSVELIALQAPQAHPEGAGRQWYGLFPADWEAVPSAISDLQYRIRDLENKDISLKETIILGFSQGGAMAIAAGCELNLGGIIACSSYPHPGWVMKNDRPKVFLTHGTKDEIVPCQASEHLLIELQKNNKYSDLFLFNGGHEIPNEALRKIIFVLSQWLI